MGSQTGAELREGTSDRESGELASEQTKIGKYVRIYPTSCESRDVGFHSPFHHPLMCRRPEGSFDLGS